MRSTKIKILLLSIFCLIPLISKAQFKDEAFSQNYGSDDPSVSKEKTDKIFDIKNYFQSLGHKSTMNCATSFEGSLICVGGMQIYNKDYWKLPIVYGGLAAGIGGGIYYNSVGNSKASTLCYIGAGLVYWGTLFDGVISYQPNDWPNPQKATLYSLLLPGLGQIYNHEIWKLPVYWGLMIGSGCYYLKFKENYERFRAIYNAEDTTYIPLETSKYYKDVYRRYRDYALLALVASYLIQVIDANVFAYMHDFEISEDISMNVAPTVISPVVTGHNDYALNVPPAVGLGINFKF